MTRINFLRSTDGHEYFDFELTLEATICYGGQCCHLDFSSYICNNGARWFLVGDLAEMFTHVTGNELESPIDFFSMDEKPQLGISVRLVFSDIGKVYVGVISENDLYKCFGNTDDPGVQKMASCFTKYVAWQLPDLKQTNHKGEVNVE